MIEPSNPVLSKMLDRLFASMVNGPSMNCRPQASRQRVDLVQLSRLRDVEPGAAFLALLGNERTAKLTARVPIPTKAPGQAPPDDVKCEQEKLSPEERASRQSWSDQQSILTKFRVIADDARTYEQDTGVHALNVGFPLLSLPPGTFGGNGGLATRRVLAPIAFVPVTLTVKTGAKLTVDLACRGEGVDLVVPNITLFSWLEQQTGVPLLDKLVDAGDLAAWTEIVQLVQMVAELVSLPVPELLKTASVPVQLTLTAAPTSDDDTKGKCIVVGAILGLFPTANQGLLRDTREMIATGAADGPMESFVRHGVSLDGNPANTAGAISLEPGIVPRMFAEERLVTLADPCQTRAVRMARKCRGLVVHGPPGTGKSQTIANIIGDHLAKGERVLFVCDKRTALDVVADRLNSLGLADLCATVHDPQRDQREFYRSVREQLDNLADTPLKADAAEKLAKIDAELQVLHEHLSQYYSELMGGHGGPGSFHHLMGQWLAETGDVGNTVDERSLQNISAAEFERHKDRLREVLERGEAIAYVNNPWKAAAGLELAKFLSQPMQSYQRAVAECASSAAAVDATVDPHLPPFELDADLMSQAERYAQTAVELRQLASLPLESAVHWTKQPAAHVESARTRLSTAAGWASEVKRKPLDDALLHTGAVVPPAQQIAAERQSIVEYAAAFSARADEYARLRAAAPNADEAMILKWMAADAKTALAARKRLEGAAPIAAAMEATALDASLLARFEAAPLESSKVFESLASLNAYLDIAAKWHGTLHLSKRKAAEPAVRHFGLSLNPASAAQVKQFLSDVQKRSDLRGAIEAAIGRRFETLPDDGELLTAFKNNRDMLVAVGSAKLAAGDGVVVPTLGESAVAGLNALLGTRSEMAQTILGRYGLPTDGKNASASIEFLNGLEARIHLVNLLGQVAFGAPVTVNMTDAELIALLELHWRLLDLIAKSPVGTPLGDTIAKALVDRQSTAAIIKALDHAVVRATAMLEAHNVLVRTGLFSQEFLKFVGKALRNGRTIGKAFAALGDKLATLEGVLRVKDGLARLPERLSTAASTLLTASCKATAGYSAVRRAVLAGEIVRQLKGCPNLQAVDGHRLRNTFDRFKQLSEEKKHAVRDTIQSRWVSRQKGRLLASTGTRLNTVGADLRRRLTVRGERAMRLRQVIAHGAGLEGGDPLFDLRPVWMASPETVSQLFPRQAIFDVVVFDEASQCRLEEALPVLTRAKRVVIAGDPKQLPPTRFFESAVTTSGEMEAETDAELFESHQGEVEDLLSAALGLDIDQCYLDVHYRSRNADLIGFSNQHFYGSRLQAIPSHPRSRTRYAPITLYRATGVYEKRRNIAEAELVCKIVRDLLKRAQPPSVGIACFNMVQRDLIVEKLEELAEQDPEFAGRLAEARERRGLASSEALFVKNLENVQGDERDHLIISTTYGPDATGKFRRSFGPLGSAGGGRRLNVLVTRAKNELHIVTSIPRSAYASLPEIPSGSTPTGAWLLFAYLAYAEQLQQDYETNHRIIESSGPAERASVETRTTRTPSTFAKALASRVAATHNHGSDVHWGNEGFCVDMAMHHPTKAEDVTVGVLCDMTRYMGSDDPVEWDVFRTNVHEGQGWRLHRVWTPHFFRDPAGAMDGIGREIQEVLQAEELQGMKPADHDGH